MSAWKRCIVIGESRARGIVSVWKCCIIAGAVRPPSIDSHGLYILRQQEEGLTALKRGTRGSTFVLLMKAEPSEPAQLISMEIIK